MANELVVFTNLLLRLFIASFEGVFKNDGDSASLSRKLGFVYSITYEFFTGDWTGIE